MSGFQGWNKIDGDGDVVMEDSEKPLKSASGNQRMTKVEIPRRQTALTDYFIAKPIPPTPKKKESAYIYISDEEYEDDYLFTTSIGRKRVLKDESDDDEAFIPDGASESEEEEISDALPTEDESMGEQEEEDVIGADEDEEKPKRVNGRTKVKGRAAPMPKGKRVKEEDRESDVDGPKEKKKKIKHKSIPKPCGIKIEPREGDLPPMSDLETIFLDILTRIPGALQDFMGPDKYRKLRVATMCSGTESPLLALNMFSRQIKKMGWGTLDIEHVFSCEIEPYKQAYIERNFKPPILFRDIRELGYDKATTAYGTLVDVPGDVGLLVAGTSCVDFSNLNNQQKSIEEGGESGDTFLGMMAWARKHRPAIIIQENVVGAAWGDMRAHYLRSGYTAEFSTQFDSKKYYIPHTRQRGYLCAFDTQKPGVASDLPNKWLHFAMSMQRTYTSTFEAFMLPDDDPRVHKARLEMAGDGRNGPTKSRTVDWERCEGRHNQDRKENKLGLGRPLTAWEEGGICKVLDFMWQDWGTKQVDRVLDLMDINYLKEAKKHGYDAMHKAGFWNLSQNVDRNTVGGLPRGICPCLTPHMIPFLAYRGGPMVGIETLHMQGLPIHELLLTRETSQQIQNLAGNAMSSTVVGTTMLCAMILAKDILPKPTKEELLNLKETEVDVYPNITGEDALVSRKLDLATTVDFDLNDIIMEAQKSSRLCICEGRSSITKTIILCCKECGYTVCNKCGGRPSHAFQQSEDPEDPSKIPEVEEYKAKNRLSPLSFEHKLKSFLPMRLQLSKVSQEDLDRVRTSDGDFSDMITEKDWKLWSKLALSALNGEFRFKALLRQEQWTVVYQAPHAKMELVLKPRRPEWRIFPLCPKDEGLNSRTRELCKHPVARMSLSRTSNPLFGKWDICLPTEVKFDISIKGQGTGVDGWKKALGLEDDESLQDTVWSHLKVSVPDDVKGTLERDISGRYKLLPNCGAAQASLHIRVSSEDDMDETPLFFFIDQTRILLGNDCFVFSEDHRRLAFDETRPVIAKLQPEFRQPHSDDDKVHKAKTTVRGHWVSLPRVKLSPPAVESASSGVLYQPGPRGLNFSAEINACEAAQALIVCKVPLQNQAEPIWPMKKWVEIDKIHEHLTYENLAWLTERIRSMKALSAWTEVDLPQNLHNCERCAPMQPPLKWVKMKGRYRAIEDTELAAPYERALKNRPAVIVTQLHLADNMLGTLRIGLNIPTLLHRALARFPANPLADKPKMSWRLVTDYVPSTMIQHSKYLLPSNRKDPHNPQPPHFRRDLRPEQLRSLYWMLRQEADDVKPFIEEEVAEQLFPELNWRAEGRVERPFKVLGGVVADEVGYGKTAISLGLIDSTQDYIQLPTKMDGMIPVKATIIVVPGHLSMQWPAEIVKFTGTRYKVLEIKNQGNLNKLSAKDIMGADIILVAASFFQSAAYLESLAKFSGSRPPPVSEGRRFVDWQKETLENLKEQVKLLRNDGVTAVKKMIEEKARYWDELLMQEAEVVRLKRVIGAAYIASKQESTGKRKRSDDDDSADISGDDSEESISRKMKKTKITGSSGKRSYTAGSDWNLSHKLTVGDWRHMKTPPLQMFHFNRIIVDEFTYIKGQIHAGITSLHGRSRWVLSGTPGLEDFNDIKTMALFLGIHLGIDDESEATKVNMRKIVKERTGVERFTAFEDLRSTYWHQRRHEVAQGFLDKFVRQNVAEIDEIPREEHIIPVHLPAAELAIYLELDNYLAASDYNIRKTRVRADNDRDRRTQEALGECKSADEALIKRCSHYEMQAKDEVNAVHACAAIVKSRKDQLASIRDDIRRGLLDCVRRYDEIGPEEWAETGWKDVFKIGVDAFHEGIGDADANHDIEVLIKEAMARGKPTKVVYVEGTEADPKIPNPPRAPPTKEEYEEYKKRKAQKKTDLDDDDQDEGAGGSGMILLNGQWKKFAKLTKKEKDQLLEQDTHVGGWPRTKSERYTQLKDKFFPLRNLVRNELVGRHRGLRFFRAVRDFQRLLLEKGTRTTDVDCAKCGKRKLDISEAAVFTLCGHTGCYDCLSELSKTIKCIAPKCDAAKNRKNVILKADDLGVEEKKDGDGKHFGRKLEKVVELIKEHIPKDDKVLLFVQFKDLLDKVAKVLKHHGIKFLQISGSADAQGKTVHEFQNSQGATGPKVMLLNVMQQSSSGANFTNANHAILLSPLLTETQYEYESSETQAIGRVLRYGQMKKVHIWRFMTENTIDTKVFVKRTGRERQLWEPVIYNL
ncbi:hypothetical protein EX30DRAFT_327192 [Ascodesmis nigricans]|uniref:Helicase C-terminal domain-containing protein n=1 Tax=Ascodesmis nigricans TaxID=341454 RepID=A0A4S2N352_9PEZI|nr:hypothetical protein EX30DRAFT_327192 [Ascodesmis nigricans]